MKKIIISILALFMFGSFAAAQNFDKQAQFCTYVRTPVGQGYRGGGVKEVQWMMQQYNAPWLQATDYYGPVTVNAVKAFQRQFGIRQTGAVGPQTLAKMRSIWCAGSTVVNPVYPTVLVSGDPVISLSPVSSSGYNVTLGWSTQNASICSLNGEPVTVNGSRAYNIYAETSFKMICSNQAGRTAESTILVKPSATSTAVPTISLYSNPATFYNGQTIYVVWNTTNATSCTLNGQSVTTSGSQQVIAGNVSTYTLSCTGPGGASSQTLNLSSNTTTTCPSGYVMVNGVCSYQNTFVNPTINSFVNNSNNNLSWSTSNAVSCTLAGQNFYGQSVLVNGTQSLPSYQNGSVVGPFTLTCIGSNGQSVSQTISQTTSNTSNGYVSLSQPNVTVGGSLAINWSAPSSYSGQVQGVMLSLYDNNNNFLGGITRTANTGSGSYTWIVPTAVSNPNTDAMTCKMINGVQVCGGSPINEVVTGTYKVRATFFTPSNACFSFCQQVAGQQTLGYVESQSIVINK